SLIPGVNHDIPSTSATAADGEKPLAARPRLVSCRRAVRKLRAGYPDPPIGATVHNTSWTNGQRLFPGGSNLPPTLTLPHKGEGTRRPSRFCPLPPCGG